MQMCRWYKPCTNTIQGVSTWSFLVNGKIGHFKVGGKGKEVTERGTELLPNPKKWAQKEANMMEASWRYNMLVRCIWIQIWERQWAYWLFTILKSEPHLHKGDTRALAQFGGPVFITNLHSWHMLYGRQGEDDGGKNWLQKVTVLPPSPSWPVPHCQVVLEHRHIKQQDLFTAAFLQVWL